MRTDVLELLPAEIVMRLQATPMVAAIENADDRKKLIAVAGAVAEAVKDLPEGIPSGHLYVALQGHLDLLTYQLVLSVLVRAGMISVVNHYIRWIPA